MLNTNVKPCFIWYDKSEEIYHVCDVMGFSYGRGSSKNAAVDHAVSIGVSLEDIEGALI